MLINGNQTTSKLDSVHGASNLIEDGGLATVVIVHDESVVCGWHGELVMLIMHSM